MATKTTTEPPPWPPEWARTIAFFVGLGLMGWEAVIDHSESFFLYGPAFLLTGLPVVRGAEKLLDLMGGKK